MVTAESIIQRSLLPKLALTPLVFLLSLSYFVYLSAPDVTWVHVFHDMGDTLWSTYEFGLAHPQGAPLYVLLGNILTYWQSDLAIRAWTLAVFLSAVPAAITATILYHDTRKFWVPLLFCASMIVTAQATVPKYYALVSLLVLLQWKTRDSESEGFRTASFLGMTLHHLNVFAWLYLLVYRYRKGLSWKHHLFTTPIGVAAIYLVYYLLAENPPDNVGWAHAPFHRYLFGQGFLLMGLSVLYVEEVTRRLSDLFFILLPSIGFALLLVPFVKDKWLLGLAGIFVLHYATNLDPHTFTYLTPAVTLLFLGVGQVEWKPTSSRFYYVSAVYISSVLLIAWNVFHMDIGNNLDPAPTTARQYIEELQSIPEGSVIYAGDAGWYDLASFLVENRHTVLYPDYCHSERLPEYERVTPDYLVTNLEPLDRGPKLIAWADAKSLPDCAIGKR